MKTRPKIASSRRCSSKIVTLFASGAFALLAFVSGGQEAMANPDQSCHEGGASNSCYKFTYRYKKDKPDYNLLSYANNELAREAAKDMCRRSSDYTSITVSGGVGTIDCAEQRK